MIRANPLEPLGRAIGRVNDALLPFVIGAAWAIVTGAAFV